MSTHELTSDDVEVQTSAILHTTQFSMSLDRSYTSLVKKAVENKEWDRIINSSNPIAALEKYALKLSCPDVPEVDIIQTIKSMKKILIYRNMTFLEAYENSMLKEIYEFMKYRENHFHKKKYITSPDNIDEECTETKMEKAEKIIKVLQDKQED